MASLIKEIDKMTRGTPDFKKMASQLTAPKPQSIYSRYCPLIWRHLFLVGIFEIKGFDQQATASRDAQKQHSTWKAVKTLSTVMENVEKRGLLRHAV